MQRSFKDQFVRIFADPSQERTVLVVSSLSVDQKVLSTVTAAIHYEERLLCLLLLLKLPRTRVIYVSSAPISDDIVEYFLQLGRGAETSGARDRLTLLDCADVSPRSLTEKILERPEMIERIETALGD
ncbi:MAG: carboxylate-amine ligase, partial [Pseudomonadota bacterium]